MLAQAFRRWQRKHALSAVEIARVASVSRQCVRNWVTGENEPLVGSVLVLDRKWPGLLKELQRSSRRAA